MYDYIYGTVFEINKDSIVLDNNGIGYKIYTSNPYSFKELKQIKVYTYMHTANEILTLYGFKTSEERSLFLKLISVSGIGPKSAIAILATGNVNNISEAINNGDVKYLCKFPGIGQKSAQQIILDLKGKVDTIYGHGNYLVLDEVHDALSVLGYNEKDINKVLPQLDTNLSTSELIKIALTKILGK